MVNWVRYDESHRSAWDEFVKTCRSPLFFFERGFMEYHADRFTDHSLLCFEDDALIAVLPASLHGDTLISHGGLTFGGMLLSERCRAGSIVTAFKALLEAVAQAGVSSVLFKSIPYVFQCLPSQEDLYALHQLGGRIVRRDLSSVIHLDNRLKLSKGRKALIARARKEGLSVTVSADFERFHALLSDVLQRHGASPVHSVAELRLLHERFPHNIRLYTVVENDTLLAASLIFLFGQTRHTQYLCTSERGKEVGALDFLIEEIISEAASSCKYFSFGISTEQQGTILNSGLIAQKEGFGARGLVLDTYRIDL